MTADPTYGTGVYEAQGGNAIVAGTNGVINIDGGQLQVAGVDKTTALTNAVASTAAGVRQVVGSVALGGTNPTSVATGLTTVTGGVVTLQDASAPGLDPVIFTVDFGGAVPAGTLNIYAWKFTSNANPTLIASTSTLTVAYVAFGT